ncbi:PREDICTED: probable chitinase 2 [Polistes dominula]|uniref:Probable chitinase 2 n=1 Tax=Polistes dominula TaxID=743375 RepID=A0ABM1IHM7_POLDO|nr:PREDICTED: probable chitinase 2 [Polistes dominula]XP_015179711.1 PREDICTED: probable chitinase 2 [Polistes dominula]XP_015179713.1 PREDICTED: probable chitinase 2 [Polistes dominula]XP_015179714.1 PREDICTED: probable chitinase 2 [Polistes dominula]
MNPMKYLTSCLVMLFFFYIDNIQGQEIPKHGKVVACYVAGWARYRPSNGKFTLDNLKPQHCTHLIYAFAGLNTTTWEIKSLDTWADIEDGIGNYQKMSDLHKNYPGLKVSIAIGGWNEGSENYSILAQDENKRKSFINSISEFLKKYKFDGVDLDWEFPSERGGNSQDKDNFSLLIKELKQQLPQNSILTAAISANKKIIDKGYNISYISKYLDYIHVMTYDYHGSWDLKILPNAPLYSNNDESVNATVSYLLQLGAPAKKLVLGLPMYGRTYISNTKISPGENPTGMPCGKDGFNGSYTRQNGFMGYNEICEEVKDKKWISGWDNDSNTPYAVNEDRVIFYDDYISLKTKALYAKEMNLAGVMIWSIDTDDHNGICGTDYILMKSINKAFINKVSTDKTSSHKVSIVLYAIVNILIFISL